MVSRLGMYIARVPLPALGGTFIDDHSAFSLELLAIHDEVNPEHWLDEYTLSGCSSRQLRRPTKE